MKITIFKQDHSIKNEIITEQDLNNFKIPGLDTIYLNEREKEAFHLIQGIFILEKIIKYNQPFTKHNLKKNMQLEGETGQNKSKNTKVTIEMDYLKNENLGEFKMLLNDIFLFTELIDIDFNVRTNNKTPKQQESVKRNEINGTVCLFSGGVDSVAGIISESVKNNYPTIGLYISYNQIGGVIKKERELLSSWKIPNLKDIYTLKIKRGASSVQHVRGFVFTSLGILVASALGYKNLVISEIGPVMFQPIYNILDEVTITTHPYTLEMSKRIMAILIDSSVEIKTPFDEKTKAEIVHDLLKNSPGGRKETERLLLMTHSCRRSNFANANNEKRHCGYCLGCVIRHSAFILNGIEDENSKDYERDVWGIEKIENGGNNKYNSQIIKHTLDNLLPLLEFSRSILLMTGNNDHPIGYAKVKQFNREELFKRFSLEILSTLHKYYGEEGKGSNHLLKEFYEDMKKSGKIDVDILNNKLSEFSK